MWKHIRHQQLQKTDRIRSNIQLLYTMAKYLFLPALLLTAARFTIIDELADRRGT